MEKNKEYIAPIPRNHVAKLAGISWDWLRVLIDQEKLPALELVQDEETLESILIPYVSTHSVKENPNRITGYSYVRDRRAKQQSLFIAPGVAMKFIKDRQGQGHVTEGENIIAPVPLSHLSRRTALSVQSLLIAIEQDNLQAMEFILDEELLRSSLVPYIPNKEKRRGKALFVLPDEARRFIKAEQEKRDEIQDYIAIEPDKRPKRIPVPRKTREEREAEIRKRALDPVAYIRNAMNRKKAKPLTDIELEEKVLEAAQFLKKQDPNGEVERIKVLEIVSEGKRNNMHLYKKIKYILDQHIDEFPPHHSGPHAFLAKQRRAKKSKE